MIKEYSDKVAQTEGRIAGFADDERQSTVTELPLIPYRKTFWAVLNYGLKLMGIVDSYEPRAFLERLRPGISPEGADPGEEGILPHLHHDLFEHCARRFQVTISHLLL